jgi:putative copper resistance protein D
VIEACLIAVQAVHFAAAFALFGAALFRLYAVPPAPIAPPFNRVLVNLMRTAAVVVALSALTWWVCLAASLGEGWGDALNGDVLAAVLLDTQFGKVWVWRLALLAVAVGMVRWPRPSGAGNAATTAVAGLVVASLAGIGHPAHAGIPEEVHVGARAAHFLAAAAWLGGLLPLGYVLRQASRARRGEWSKYACRVLPRFSSLGYFAVSLVLLSGCVMAWSHVESFAALVGTRYGQALIAKICLFLLVTGVALFNRLRLIPKLSFPALARSVLAEQAVGVAIVIVAAVLANLPPPHD